MPLNQKSVEIPTGGTTKLNTRQRIRSVLINNLGANNVTLRFGTNEGPITLPPSTSINLTVFDLFDDKITEITVTGTAGDDVDFLWVEGHSGLDAFFLALMGRA